MEGENKMLNRENMPESEFDQYQHDRQNPPDPTDEDCIENDEEEID